MDKFLDIYDQPNLNKKDINHLNRSITQNEIKAAIKSLPKKKVQDLKDSLMNSIRPLKN
jgi:NADH/NAD ratio-sensing transcriptional regulator Rex